VQTAGSCRGANAVYSLDEWCLQGAPSTSAARGYGRLGNEIACRTTAAARDPVAAQRQLDVLHHTLRHQLHHVLAPSRGS